MAICNEMHTRQCGFYCCKTDLKKGARAVALYLVIVAFIFGKFYCIKVDKKDVTSNYCINHMLTHFLLQYFPESWDAEYMFTVFSTILLVVLSYMVYYGIRADKP